MPFYRLSGGWEEGEDAWAAYYVESCHWEDEVEVQETRLLVPEVA
jgi:hypothetical protein